jgi:hypothetical protein
VARKLLCMGALITLASLAQVTPAIACIYVFPGGSATIESWTEIIGADQDSAKFTVNIVFGTANAAGNLSFSINLSGLPVVSFLDLELNATAECRTAKAGGLFSENGGELFYGFALNRENISFGFTADLTKAEGDGNQYVFITNFSLSLSYADPSTSPVPLPGAVWLLGAGLMGLGCVGWRRQKII